MDNIAPPRQSVVGRFILRRIFFRSFAFPPEQKLFGGRGPTGPPSTIIFCGVIASDSTTIVFSKKKQVTLTQR